MSIPPPARLEQCADEYRTHGFSVLPALFSAADVEALRAEAVAICRGEHGAVIGALPPEEAASLADDEVMTRYLAIHFPHKISVLMLATMRHPGVVAALQALIGPNVKAMQSMLFVKGAGKPGQAWHQDEFYIPTRDRSLLGAWIALDDATVENGGLWMLPGSHRRGVIYPTRPHGDPRFDVSEEAYGFPEDESSAVAVEVEAGSVVFFHGYALHRSLPNRRTRGFRRALVNHYMSAESLLPWGFGGKARSDWRDIVTICGEDPYEWKGIEDVAPTFCRPEGKP